MGRAKSNLIKWEMEFEPNYSLLLIDFILRVLIAIPGIFGYFPFNAFFIVLLHIFTTFFIVYISKRRRSSIHSFLQMRLLSEQADEDNEDSSQSNLMRFKEINLHTKTVNIKNDGRFVFLLFLIPVAISISFFSNRGEFFHFISDQYRDITAILLLFATGGLFYFYYWVSKDVFISNRIKIISKNKKKLTKNKMSELLKFINRSTTLQENVHLSEQNDFLIIELQTKIKIFRERLENLSLEGVFLGALSFATLMQLISPENINTLDGMGHQVVEGESYFSRMVSQLTDYGNWFYPDSLEFNLNFGIAMITIGSLLSSVFYIIVLIKRFSILKSIELAQLKIERANAWNVKEERELSVKSMKKAMRFTDQIQIELASANQICSDIQSNLSLTSLIRALGILSFFIVILVTADLIHHYLFVFSLLFAVYGVTATLLMNNRFSLKYLFKFWKTNDDVDYRFKLAK